jgi:hypothetical protein
MWRPRLRLYRDPYIDVLKIANIFLSCWFTLVKTWSQQMRHVETKDWDFTETNKSMFWKYQLKIWFVNIRLSRLSLTSQDQVHDVTKTDISMFRKCQYFLDLLIYAYWDQSHELVLKCLRNLYRVKIWSWYCRVLTNVWSGLNMFESLRSLGQSQQSDQSRQSQPIWTTSTNL